MEKSEAKDFVYLATPYTHDDEAVEEERFERVSIIAGHLMNQGYIVYSPISHNHPIAKLVKLPGTWEY